VTELIANGLLYFRVEVHEQPLTGLMTVCGRLQTYQGAASFHFDFNGEVHWGRLGLERLWVMSSDKSLSHSVT
jgi:hypothetical protein